MSVKLGVNIDHVATLRQQRDTKYPDPVCAAVLAELGGADGITVHLREDRRHIQDRDVRVLRESISTRLNLEMAPTDEIVRFACSVLPDQVTLVPEKREERTTEGGLAVHTQKELLKTQIKILRDNGIPVSLFIEPDTLSVQATLEVGAQIVEFHTGRYADALKERERQEELSKLKSAAAEAIVLGITVNAGHGLHYRNTLEIAQIPNMNELNIGHSICSYAVLIGMQNAVREMKAILKEAG